jgi:hypothetical protein
MKLAHAFLLAALLGLAGCPTSSISSAVDSANKKLEFEGSPFRYVARDDTSMVMTLLPLPAGPTRAVAGLAKKSMDSITQEEFRQRRSVATLQEVRYLQDGREVWVLQTLGDTGIAYVVSFEAANNPDSNVRMKGPYTYQK